MTFPADTMVVRRADGSYDAWLEERWQSLVGIHGGYAAAVIARAIEAEVGDPSRRLRTISVQFASPPRPGQADVEVVVERSGRSVTSTSARLLQGGHVRLLAHAISSPDRGGIAYDVLPRPEGAISGPRDAPPFEPPLGPGHFRNVDVRIHPDVVPFGGGPDAWVAGWIAPHDGPVDLPWVVAMCDVLPPSVFSRTTGPVGAASLELTVHLVVERPVLRPGEHTFLEYRSALSAGGFLVEDAVLWGPGGEVWALARQTRLAGTAPAGAPSGASVLEGLRA